MRRRAALALVLAVLLTAAACGSGNKSGGPAKPVELVLTNYDSDGARTAPAMGQFVDRVKARSGGKLVVRIKTGDFATDGAEIRDVAAGRADLGWSGTRVLDVMGVKEFSPLHAPFLIDSFELQKSVLTSDAPAPMLAAMKRLGIEGLAILGDGLRFPAAGRSPLVSAADWKGAGIWLLDSLIQAAGVEALGARVIHGGDIRQMLVDKTASGLEAMWIYYVPGADFLYAPYITPNVVLSPRTNVLFANPASMTRLSTKQRAWVREAATDASTWSVDHASDGVAGYVKDACKYGARIALASPTDLDGLRAAVAPVYAGLRSDPATGGSLAAIEGLKSKIGAPAPLAVPDDCRYRPGEEAAAAALPKELTGPGATGDFPRGTYRYELTSDEVVEAGKAGSIGDSAGIFTWEMGAGEWTVTAVPSDSKRKTTTCRGWYAVDGPRVTFSYGALAAPVDQHCLPPVWTARWAPGDNAVRWGPPSAPVLAPYFSLRPWKRIS
jgi:TRAP-type C4-dicarboxylate transport system substrate-binding protein